MQYMAFVRILVVGGACVAALGSATSNGPQQQGYYPRPPQQAPYPPPASAPPQGSPPPQPGYYPPAQGAPPADPYAGVSYGGAPYGGYAAPATPPPPAQPTPPTQPPQKRTQWVCNATGWWQKCESNGYPCYAQSSTMLGFGTTEAAARVSSETECNTAMSRLMSVNFTYRTSVTQRCKAVSCTPPTSK